MRARKPIISSLSPQALSVKKPYAFTEIASGAKALLAALSLLSGLSYGFRVG